MDITKEWVLNIGDARIFYEPTLWLIDTPYGYPLVNIQKAIEHGHL